MKKVIFNGFNERVFKEKSIGRKKKIKVYKPNLLVYLNFYFHHYPCFMTLAWINQSMRLWQFCLHYEPIEYQIYISSEAAVSRWSTK